MRTALLAVAVTIAPVVLVAQALMEAPHQAGLLAYHRTVVLLETHKASVEQVFYRGLSIRDLLLKPDPRGTTVLESLSSGEFDELKKEFAGFVIGRDEAVYVNPDPTYFTDVARQFGDPGDQAFFEAYRQTRPSGVWPAWIDQQGGGCTKYGDGDLVAAYQRWTDFRQAHPRKYRAETEEFLNAVEYEVSTATCACGDAASVLKELEEFDRAFPHTRVSDAVRVRIGELRDERSKMRFGCTAGPASRIVR